jgi:predicted phosphodiesterase
MRIALVSDIHGNALALAAVLKDVATCGADLVACLGDTATLGPRPVEVLERLRDLGGPCIMGNHDAFLIDPALVARYTRAQIIVEAIDWCRSQLQPAHLAFVKGFAPLVEMPLDAGRTLLLFHGSPRSHMHDLLSTTDPEELERWLGSHQADVMAGGHTHIQMLRQHQGTWLVNPGSVGMPFRQFVHGERPEILPYAAYAMVEASAERVQVELRRVELPKAALREAVASWHGGPPLLRQDLLAQYA